jgi:hypothetical protein
LSFFHPGLQQEVYSAAARPQLYLFSRTSDMDRGNIPPIPRLKFIRFQRASKERERAIDWYIHCLATATRQQGQEEPQEQRQRHEQLQRQEQQQEQLQRQEQQQEVEQGQMLLGEFPIVFSSCLFVYSADYDS